MTSVVAVALVVAVAVVALAASPAHAINFRQWKDCKSCVDAGYGWCPIKRICGGFANKQCGEGERYVAYPPGEGPPPPPPSQCGGGGGSPSGPAPAIDVDDKDVTVITDASFEAVIKGASMGALVEYYAPWCGHCKNLAPTYAKLGTTFANADGLVIGKVDATVNAASAKAAGVTGYPTLIWYDAAGNPEKYSGARSGDALTTFVNGKTGLARSFGQDPPPAVDLTKGILSSASRYLRMFFAATAPDEKEVAIEKLSERVQGDTVEFYSKVLAKVVDKGEAFVAKQIKRVSKLLKKARDVSKGKKNELQAKLNVLNHIAQHAPSLADEMAASGNSKADVLAKIDALAAQIAELRAAVLAL